MASAAAAVLTLLANRSGPRITQDSANYLAMAASWLRDGSLVGVGGEAVTVFPPGYPVLVAAGTAAIGDVWLRILPVLCSAATVVAAGAVLRRHVTSRWWFGVGVGAVAMSPALHLVWGSAWSEGPFVAAMSLFLVAVDRLWTSGASTSGTGDAAGPTLPVRWVVAAVVAAWAATSIRYAGIVAVPVLGATVALRSRSWCARDAARGALLAATSLVVPVAIAVRNIGEDGTAFGPRVSARTAVVDLVGGGVDTVLRWLVPGAAVAGGVVALVFVGSILVGGSRSAVRTAAVDLAPVVATGAAYVLTIAGSATVASIDGLDDRLLSPVVVPVVLFAVVVLARLDAAAPARWSTSLRIGSLAWVGLAGIASLTGAIAPLPSLSTSARGSGPVVAAAAQLPEGAELASNAPELLWTWTGRDSIRQMPSSAPIGWVPADADATGFLDWLSCIGGSAVVVWFDQPWDDPSIAPNDLPGEVQVARVSELAGGAVYDVRLPAGRRTCSGG